jgi:3-oxoacyl-[acyl-carrier protein] reductase
MPTAIITGAGRGIGRACAVRLASLGYGLTLVARTGGELEETARLAGEAGASSCLTAVGDVADEAFVRATVEMSVRRGGGRIDALVLCAGVAPAKPVEAMDVVGFRAVIESNLIGAYGFVHHAWGYLKGQAVDGGGAGRGGAIVMISSLSTRDPFSGLSAYAAAKGAINTLTMALDREGKAHGIRVYAVAPGAVETKLFRAVMSKEQYGEELTLKPAEVAEVVAQCIQGSLVYCAGETIFMRK